MPERRSNGDRPSGVEIVGAADHDEAPPLIPADHDEARL
jgi:hypothetical protein